VSNIKNLYVVYSEVTLAWSFQLFGCFKAGKKHEQSGEPKYFVANKNAERVKELAEKYTGVPPYPLIQYPHLQLSAVHHSPKRI
jgi:hypothetical protein